MSPPPARLLALGPGLHSLSDTDSVLLVNEPVALLLFAVFEDHDCAKEENDVDG